MRTGQNVLIGTNSFVILMRVGIGPAPQAKEQP